MTKLITITSIRAGTGRTTVAAILAEKLSKQGTVLIIDNNKSNINIYDVKVSSIENIKLYLCLENKESCKNAIKESATEIKNNIFFFSGSQELLTEKELKFLKEQDNFDYIILDTMEQIPSIADTCITVINPNIHEYHKYIEAKKDEELSKSNILINKYTDEIEFKTSIEDFKLYFCSEIINFTNSYELNLQEDNDNEISKLIEKITGENHKPRKRKIFDLMNIKNKKKEGNKIGI
ncbi:cellulose biosynthesis protein BcsQ [Sedimentibacter acidaminivorans]|uniref:Cellulose biosynthesis protein BcsQ n=1 Tax=Sedimentibacter acidaminivorans TaxID=913099 RepID=A0ABS4GGA8_9FIRM|nr:cellulose synthase operon protein YhjQ/BcsQ [Sedimentibacter acidaminivorans]MBP1926735.1 cellulose biosynthesis protein BcsQ [Sedimentibacter acidaminivorans]